ncbi:hypothetical protein Tco_1395210 [Tanacetum coccineum]
MVEPSSQNPPSSNKIPKEEPVTYEKPESSNPFLPAHKVNFDFDAITFATNNEVSLLYPEHLNSQYFKPVSDFISKCRLKEAFTRAPNQYAEYLAKFWYTAKTIEGSKIWVSTPTGGIKGEIGITTFRYAFRADYLPHSSEDVTSPSLALVRQWFSTIRYSGEIRVKGTLKKAFLPPRWRLLMGQIIYCLGGKSGGHYQISNKDVILLYCLENGVKVNFAKIIWDELLQKNAHNWALKQNQPEEPPFTDHMLAICQSARKGLRRKQSSKHASESQTEASKSKTSQSTKENQSSSAKDKNPNQPSASTPVDDEMHKEEQKAAGGLGATSEDKAYPQLSSGMSVFTHLTYFNLHFSLVSDINKKTKTRKKSDKTEHEIIKKSWSRGHFANWPK